MKKTILILLALVMALSLVACGGKDDKTTDKDEQSVAASTDTASKEESKEESAPAVESKEESKEESKSEPAEESTPAEESKEESKPEQTGGLTRGTVTGDVYTSSYNGLTFTLGEGWSFATDEEIAETMNIGLDVLNKDFGATVEELSSAYDMMAKDAATGCSVFVLYENLEGNKLIDDEEDYAAMLKAGLQTMQDQIEYTFSDTSTATISGQPFTAVEATANYAGVSLSQAYYVRMIDNYMVNIIVTAVGETDLADILAMFS